MIKSIQLFKLTPILPNTNPLIFGDSRERKRDLCLVGELAEYGKKRKIYYDCSGEHVIAIVGKRGSGKSYTLGSIIEGFGLEDKIPEIAQLINKRGVLLFDTLDIYWTTLYPVTDSENPTVKKQYEDLKRFGIKTSSVNVKLWIPGGYEAENIDLPDTNVFYLNVSDLEPSDWAILFNIDLIGEPRGHLLNDVYHKVTVTGWYLDSKYIEPKQQYSLKDIITCLNRDRDINSEYKLDTIRSLRQRFQSIDNWELFRESGTQLTELIKEGVISILMLGRLDTSTRELIATVLFKKILDNRIKSSYVKKRLQLDPSINDQQRKELQNYLYNSIPRTWIAIDEAQNLIPSDRKTKAQDLIIKYVKEGRNFGLSLIITTQQPSSIDSKVMSQVDTMFIHQLSNANDIKFVIDNIKSDIPKEIIQGNRKYSITELLRNLTIGTALVSCSESTKDIQRCFLLHVRPRITIHGGFED